MEREIKIITPEYIEDYLTIYLNAYPAYKNIGDEGRDKYRPRILFSMQNDKNIHFYGLFEDGKLIANMKLIDFSMNAFGEMQKAVGLMALGVHPLHKKKGAARDMVRFFEKYTKETGAIVSMLLPFRMDFYRKMGYGYGSKLDEYTLPTLNLPEADKGDLQKLRFMRHDDVPKMLECHKDFVAKNHGMLNKFEDEIRDIEGDTETRRVGYFDGDKLLGYVAYQLACESDVNYTLNRMDVKELVYCDSKVLRTLLGYLRTQGDLAQTAVLRTGDADFYHVLPSAQDISGNYIDFGFLQSNVSALGTMCKIVDPEAFVRATSYRKFIPLDVVVRFIYDDEFAHEQGSLTLKFDIDGSYSVAGSDNVDVTVKCKLSVLSSLLMGSCGFSSLVRLGEAELSDSAYENWLDMLFYCKQRPWTNTDY